MEVVPDLRWALFARWLVSRANGHQNILAVQGIEMVLDRRIIDRLFPGNVAGFCRERHQFCVPVESLVDLHPAGCFRVDRFCNFNKVYLFSA